MSQVIIVSNRLPVNVKKVDGRLEFSPSVGGLATGLSSYVSGKNNIWIGWPGIASDDLTASEHSEITERLAKHHCVPVFLTRRQVDSYYNGYSNTVLWPLFHELRPQDRPGKRREGWYRTYRDVNKLFANAVEAARQDGAYVWVHDYQLLLLPAMLRERNAAATIGFFLHIPFPSFKKFLRLSDGKKIIKGMLGADLIGFHTPGYVGNFMEACRRAGYNATGDNVYVGSREVHVADFPMGIDFDKYASSGRSRVVRHAVAQYKRQYSGRKVIVAIDRLDPSKGLLERLQAFGEFLHHYPEYRNKVVLVMVASPSRTDIPAYRRLASRMDRLVNEINHTYGTSSWQPINYINHTLPFEHVTALFQIADVAFIAPLKDGMNLAAKEFVASTHKNSVLILSQTAGAAQELQDALIVDPRKQETVVQALHDALTMKQPELRDRLKRMKHHLKAHTVHRWAKEFTSALNKPLVIPRQLAGASQLDEGAVSADFVASRKRLMLLDYDGTLVPFHTDPAKVRPSRELVKAIGELARNPQNDIVIISGRSAQDLVERFGKLPVHLVAEHGASVRHAGQMSWRTVSRADARWQSVVLPLMEKYAALTPGAHVEVKAHSLVWHYRASPPYSAHKHMTIMRQIIKPFLNEHGLVIQKGSKVFEVKDPAMTKGIGARQWLKGGYSFVLAAGDDVTDEDMFREVPESAYSIKVGRGLTAARYRIADHTAMVRLLKRLVDADRRRS